jgi:hypothetical protein
LRFFSALHRAVTTDCSEFGSTLGALGGGSRRRIRAEVRFTGRRWFHCPPELIVGTSEAEFDRLMAELCSANPPIKSHENQFDRFIGHGAMKRANSVIAEYQELRLTLSLIKNSEYWQAARDGLLALKAGNVHLASNIASSLTHATSKSSSLARVMLGLVCFLLVAMALVSAYLNVGALKFLIDPSIFFNSVRKFLSSPNIMDATFAAAMFGGLGSVVSLLLRLGGFEAVRDRSYLYLFLFGLVQPIIGLVIGGVVGAALAAHLINVSFQQTAENAPVNIWFVAVVGFLCGFSERVAKTALATAGRAIGFEQDQQTAQQQNPGVVGGATVKLTLPSVQG